MKKKILLIFCFVSFIMKGQVVIEADGPGNTYELINSVFALPNRDVVETPDCNHEDFGRHIDEVFDKDLNKNVFRFIIHKNSDNDRCKKFDRQRNEIKTYKGSPENLKAIEGEIVVYKWKFKLNANFKPSKGFTHIHQIKSVGGPYASKPLYSITVRKGSPDQLELRKANQDKQYTIKRTDLTPFKGEWVSVEETISFGKNKSYSIEIRKIKNNNLLFDYTSSGTNNWQKGASFARPKWGIYRSLKYPEQIQDEIVRYADFSIEEIKGTVSVDDLKSKSESILLMSNSSNEIKVKNLNSKKYDAVEFYDSDGRKIDITYRIKDETIDVLNFLNGLYFLVFKKDDQIEKVLKCFVK